MEGGHRFRVQKASTVMNNCQDVRLLRACRVPVGEDSLDFAWICFLLDGAPQAAQHWGLPFGATGSVHHWDRVGELIKAIARRVAFLPLLRYESCVRMRAPCCRLFL